MSVKQLREMTGMPVGMCAKAWSESGEDLDKAISILEANGAEKASKLTSRATQAGFVGMYRHHDGKMFGVVQLNCETDFVARTEEFRTLADSLAMQAVVHGSSNFDENEMLDGSGSTIKQCLQAFSAKTGENITIGNVICSR